MAVGGLLALGLASALALLPQTGALPPGHPLTNNPLSRLVYNTYSFFYWLPRNNLPYDHPWALFRNNSIQFVQWYQLPHNLPPYRFLEAGQPEDFFCWGLPGNTLPLGNWDPWGLQLVSPRVVRRYRESELKHGRLAMLAAVALPVQELWHPLHPEIGGLAVTHMQQLRESSLGDSVLGGLFPQTLADAGPPLDYLLVLVSLAACEVFALQRHWTRWRRDEFRHQFEHNIGVGNLQAWYENGDYGFDPLRLRGKDSAEARRMQERELNHCRLAMVAFVGMLGQEYLTGLPVWQALLQWLGLSDPST